MPALLMTPEATDYFENHLVKLRFPWRLYHDPIVRGLARAVRDGGPDVLNVGAGPFLEFERLPRQGRRFTVCDIDPRAVALAKELHGDKLAGADLLQVGQPLPYASGRFDLVVAMDVIEHLPAPGPWLAELVRVTRPGGKLYLTTPNYGRLSLLPPIEATVLEWLARRKGFSRRHLHPTRFNKQLLRRTLERAGLSEVRVERVALGWVLRAHANRPP